MERDSMMIREQMEERELEYLSPYATLSKNSKGGRLRKRNVIFVRSFSVIVTGSYTARRSAD